VNAVLQFAIKLVGTVLVWSLLMYVYEMSTHNRSYDDRIKASHRHRQTSSVRAHWCIVILAYLGGKS
jgi:hypothetical protein